MEKIRFAFVSLFVAVLAVGCGVRSDHLNELSSEENFENAYPDSVATESILSDTLVLVGIPQNPDPEPEPVVAIPEIPIREQVIEIARNEIGVREIGGNNMGPRIGQYMGTVGLREGFPWCSGFAKFVFDSAGVNTAGVNGMAKSWFVKNKIIRSRTVDIKTPQTSDLFSLYYTELGRIGHVGIVEVYTDDRITAIEGNTNGGGSREGDMVMRKFRNTRQIYSFADWIDR
jgi:hypothetical protein